MIKLGAHLSIAGGYDKALFRLKEIDGNCLQIFSTSPRAWLFAKPSQVQLDLFVNLKLKLKIDPVYFHASYLINLANEGKIGHLSNVSLINEMNLASLLKIKGSIIHLGSYKNNNYFSNDRGKSSNNFYVLIDNIKEILNKTPTDSLFIIENAGNRKIGQTLEEIAKIIKKVNDKRVRICLDSCHLYSAGYDLSKNEKLNGFLMKFDSLIGLEKLECFHLNDSKDSFNSDCDRHENISQGTIPKNEFKLILTHPKLKNIPFIIETPGFDNKGPDKKNLDILKSFLNYEKKVY